MVFGVALAVAAILLSVWFANRTRPMTDEGAVLTAAARILRGGVFYRDVDAYWLPGSAYLLAGAMRAAGEHLHVARVLAGATFVGIVLVLYALAVRLAGFRLGALFGASLLGLKILAWPALTAYFYWDLAFWMACLSIWVLLTGRSGASGSRWACAGALAGGAILFKQNVGGYLGLALGLLALLPGGLPGSPRRLSDRLRSVAWLGAGAAVPIVPFVAFFGSHGLLEDLVRSGFLSAVTGYLPTSGIAFAFPLAWWRLGSFGVAEQLAYVPTSYVVLVQRGILPGESLQPAWQLAGEIFSRSFYTALAATLVAGLWTGVRRRARRDPSGPLLLASSLLAAAVFASAFPRADFTHVVSVAPLVGLVFLQLWDQGMRRAPSALARAARRLEVVAVALWLATTMALAVQHQALRSHRVVLDRAALWVEPRHAHLEALVRGLDASLAPDAPLFVYGNEAQYYFLTGRFSPWRYSQLYPGQTGAGSGREVVEALRREPPPIVVRGITRRFAGLDAIEAYAPDLEPWLQETCSEATGFFRRYPPSGGPPPPRMNLSIWRCR